MRKKCPGIAVLSLHSNNQHFKIILISPSFLSQLHYNNECKFREKLLANNYNAYESVAYPRMYIGLSKNGKTKRGNRVSPAMTVTHFLPRIQWPHKQTSPQYGGEGLQNMMHFHSKLYISVSYLIFGYYFLFMLTSFVFLQEILSFCCWWVSSKILNTIFML